MYDLASQDVSPFPGIIVPILKDSVFSKKQQFL